MIGPTKTTNLHGTNEGIMPRLVHRSGAGVSEDIESGKEGGEERQGHGRPAAEGEPPSRERGRQADGQSSKPSVVKLRVKGVGRAVERREGNTNTRTWGSKLLVISLDMTAAVTWDSADAAGGEEQKVSKCVYCTQVRLSRARQTKSD